MTMIQDTSINAYNSIKSTLGLRQRVILDTINYLKDPTNDDISRYLGLPINTITPRTNELRKKGLVCDGGKRICTRTGRMAYVWRVKLQSRKPLIMERII